MARLEQYLEADAGAMQWYLEMSETEALLSLAAQRIGKNDHNAEEVSAADFGRRQPWAWSSVAAAVVTAAAIVMVLISRHWVSRDTKFPGPLARITASIGVRWTDDQRAPSLDAALDRQTLEPATGLLEITHASGARVLIEGPARYAVTGANAGRLDYGRLVASVPPSAQGFTVETVTEKVVDHGTEFAIEMPRGGQPEVGVFRGEVELKSLDGQRSLARLFTDHAVTREPARQEAVTSIPFDRNKFIRTLPSREFKWEFVGVQSDELHTFEFDVTGLVWGGGEYRVLFKWMEGRDALDIERVALSCSGHPIADDTHRGVTGIPRHVKENIYRLTVPDDAASAASARWTLTVTCRPWPPTVPRTSRLADSRGILLFESGLALSATEEDFVGQWEYSHSGALFVRDFKPDGTATLTRDGEPWRGFDGARWSCRDGVLHLVLPAAGVTEDHILRDSATLLFVNTPYRNARRRP